MGNATINAFVEGLRQLGLAENQAGAQSLDSILQPFQLYRQELLDWNSRVNLTAITDPEDVLSKHFLDSLSLLTVYDKPHTRLLDIGSGAGFPGLPLKMVRPLWHVVLLEATGKKVTFLQHMIDCLQLQDVSAIHGRAEELAHLPTYRNAFDIVTARAVASLPVLLEYCAPFCRVGGQIILPKKGQLAEEIASSKRAAAQLGTSFKTNVEVVLPGLNDGRRLLVWEQQQPCPKLFPRSGAAIAKKPL